MQILRKDFVKKDPKWGKKAHMDESEGRTARN